MLLAPFDQQRLERWVQASHRLGGTERYQAFMVLTVQRLGRADAYLVLQEAALTAAFPEKRETPEFTFLLNDLDVLSYFWVLAGFEFIRTLGERARDMGYGDQRVQAIGKVKRRFAELRVPLAKMKPTGDSSPSRWNEWGIAEPRIIPGAGIGWAVADDRIVSRRELSDALLSLLLGGRQEV